MSAITLNREVILAKGRCPVTGAQEWLAVDHPFAEGDYVRIGRGPVVWRIEVARPSVFTLARTRQLTSEQRLRNLQPLVTTKVWHDKIGRLRHAGTPAARAKM